MSGLSSAPIIPSTVVALPGSRLGLKAGFDPARIDRVSAGRLLGHLRLAVEGLASPAARLGGIEIVGGEERAGSPASVLSAGAGLWTAPSIAGLREAGGRGAGGCGGHGIGFRIELRRT